MAWPQTVRKSDLRIDYYRGSGPGGQHRNKTDSACRITHIPTGLVAQSEDQRRQNQNRGVAFRRLCVKLEPLMRKAAQAETIKINKEVIRTYHEPRQQVKDHRIKGSWNYNRILEGKDLGNLIDKVIRSGRSTV